MQKFDQCEHLLKTLPWSHWKIHSSTHSFHLIANSCHTHNMYFWMECGFAGHQFQCHFQAHKCTHLAIFAVCHSVLYRGKLIDQAQEVNLIWCSKTTEKLKSQKQKSQNWEIQLIRWYFTSVSEHFVLIGAPFEHFLTCVLNALKVLYSLSQLGTRQINLSQFSVMKWIFFKCLNASDKSPNFFEHK